MRLTIFALILFFPITIFAEEAPRWVWYQWYHQQVSKESDKQLTKIKKSLKELERRLEQRQRRQQQAPAPQYPTKK